MCRHPGLLITLALTLWPGWLQGQHAFPPAGVFKWRSFSTDQGLTNLAVTALSQDSEGFSWAGTEDGVFRLEGDRFRRFGEEDGLPSTNVEEAGLASGLTRGMWVFTKQGIAFWNGTRFLRPSALGLPGRDQQLGRGLAQGGAILSDASAKVHYLSLDGEPFRPLLGLPWARRIIGATYDAREHRLFLALGSHLWIEKSPGSWTQRDMGPALGQDIESLWVDPQERIWIRSAERLGFLRDLQTPLELVHTPTPLSRVHTAAVSLDTRGRLWTNSPGCLLLYDGRSWTILDEKAGLPRGGAMVQQVDAEGVVWIGGYGAHKLLGEGLWSGWTTREGLPSDTVWSVTRTRDGRLWAATGGGLAVLDTNGWSTLAGTKASQILALAEDDDGNLWAGHMPSRERPYPLSVVPNGGRQARSVPLPGLALKDSIFGIAVGKGVLWFATRYGGLIRGTRQGTSLQVEAIPVTSWPSDAWLQRVALDGKGGLYVAGAPGLAHWDGRSWATVDQTSGLLENAALSLAVVPGTGEAWVGFTDAKGLVRVRREDDRLVLVETLKPPHPLVDNTIDALLTDSAGNLWVGSSRGVLRWDGRHAERYDHHDGLPGDDCSQGALWMDPNGDLFAGLSVGLAWGRMGLRREGHLPPAAAILHAARGDSVSLLGPLASTEIPWSRRTLTFRFGARGSVGTEELRYQVRLAGLEQDWLTTPTPEARYPEMPAGNFRLEVRTLNSLGETGPTAVLGLRVLPPWWRTPAMLVLEASLVLIGILAPLRWRTAILRRRNEQLEAMVHERTRALEVANAALEEASLVDPLTELHNRRYLIATMPEEEARFLRTMQDYLDRGESPLGRNEDLILVMVDLDHFKQVNDTYGHLAGDQVLVQTAKTLRSVIRDSDSLVRWGGEEFLLVAKRTDRSCGNLIAEKLCTAIRQRVYTLPDGRNIGMTASLGYSAFPFSRCHPEAFTWQDTLQVADQCLYSAKHSGRNGWVGVHTPGPVDPEDLGTRTRADLGGLVREGLLVLRSSFPEPLELGHAGAGMRSSEPRIPPEPR